MTPDEYRTATAAELAADGSTRMPPTAQAWVSPVGVRTTTYAKTSRGIEWQPRESFARRGVIEPAPGLLENFLTLREATAEQVEAFALTHGVLGIEPDQQRDLTGGYWVEPLTMWRGEATRAHDLLTAAARLRTRKPLTDDQRLPVLRAAWPDETGWRDKHPEDAHKRFFLDGAPVTERHADEPLHEGQAEALLGYAKRTLDDDRTQLAWAVSRWMHAAGAALVLTWPTNVATEPLLTIGGELQRGCLAAITVQVALACARAETTRACDYCGALHAPRRAPRPGQRSFCQQCRDNGVPVRLAHRDKRERERADKAASE